MDAKENIKNIEGLEITKLQQIANHRGDVLHMIRNDEAGFRSFGECYFSEIYPKAIKAWKKHLIQTQNIVVPIGRISLVVYDDRQNSSTRGIIQKLELGRPDAYHRVKIPSQVWYGFTCLGTCNALLVNCTDVPHSPTESLVLNVNDDTIPYTW